MFCGSKAPEAIPRVGTVYAYDSSMLSILGEFRRVCYHLIPQLLTLQLSGSMLNILLTVVSGDSNTLYLREGSEHPLVLHEQQKKSN